MTEQDSSSAASQANSPFDPTKFDPHNPAFLANPYPTYAQFRSEAPVALVQPYNSYWVFRHEDVLRVLSDTEEFSRLEFAKKRTNVAPELAPGVFGALGNMPDGVFFMDPPRHKEVRGPMDEYLKQSSADAPALAKSIGEKILGGIKAGSKFDLMAGYAYNLPSSVLLTVLGVPEEHWPGILGWISAIEVGHDITQGAGLQAMRGTCAMALGAYFQAMVRGTRTEGCPVHAAPGRLMHSLATDGIGDAPKMSAEEVQASAINLAVAGFLSTTFLLGTGMLNLLGGMDGSTKIAGASGSGLPIDLLRAQPDLLEPAINEMLRYDSPFQLVERYVVNADVKLSGVQLKVGDYVTVVIGSANRDADAFENADTFDITRYANQDRFAKGPVKPHLGFGAGIHTCYGAPLVDKVAPVAFSALLSAFPDIGLGDTTIQWKSDPFLRSPESLSLVV